MEETQEGANEAKVNAYLKKVSDNMEHAQHLTEAAWKRLSEWQPYREFQRGELTTGQAAAELKCTVYQVVKACKNNRVPGAWREERVNGYGWWHIPADSIAKILSEGYVFYADMDRAIEATQKNWIKQFTKPLDA